ncbi:hypothetical protein QC763_301020 [Podospora pseudopauciseta]|uniref:Secreted protein n=1 Tax=Podospora pseudopauciseta TaxID=2093780 RepID=A0ABR0HES1_9PEZI|nr:hypothetical protein QC763_301020 [Podospora pseudopauciseta]
MKLIPLILPSCLASAQALGQRLNFTVDATGRGCPPGSVSAAISPDAQVVTFGFDKLQAYIGPGYDLAARTSNCGVHITINRPNSHMQYAVVENTYHGYEHLDKSITLTLLSTLYRSDNAGQVMTTSAAIPGSGVGQTFTRTVAVPETEYLWSTCGSNSTRWMLSERISLTSRERGVEGKFRDEDEGVVPLTRQLRLLISPVQLRWPMLGNV